MNLPVLLALRGLTVRFPTRTMTFDVERTDLHDARWSVAMETGTRRFFS